jgi:O-antigen/teichoic acid export membrane protein
VENPLIQRLLTGWDSLSKIGRSQFLHNLVLFGGSTGAAQFLMMLNAILLARVLGPGGYGVFAGSYAVAGLSAFVISFGMDTWLLREAAHAYSPAELSGHVIKVKAKIGLVWGLALVTIIPALRPDLFSPWLMLVCVLDVWSDSCFNTQMAALNVQNRIPFISRLVLVSRGGRLLGTILFAVIGVVSPVLFALSRCSATMFSMLLAAAVLRPNLRSTLKLRAVEIFRKTFPYGISEFLALVYAQADVTLLAFLAGKTATGIYSPASGLVNALFVIPNAGYLLAVPRLTALSAQNPQRLKSFVLRLHAGFFLLGCALSAVVGLGGKWIIELLLGSKFEMTGTLLIVLSPILIFKSMEYLYAAIFVAVGWQKLRLIPQAVSAGANILLNLVAIPLFDVYGVAVVYSLSELLLLLGYGYLALKWMRSLAEVKN